MTKGFSGAAARSGFSLVELSIVLVILGLLTGGILTGQSLIRAAELRQITGNFERYTVAVNTFRDKYFALPGDLRNAVKFWGAQAGGTADGFDATCAALETAATDQATCNGDGNGKLGGRFGQSGDDFYEQFRFWQHLANAGLIEGSYAGISYGGRSVKRSRPGFNVPKGPEGNRGYSAFYLQNMDGYHLFFDGHYGNTFGYGSQVATGPGLGSGLTSTEMWGMDKKLDDGRPGQGKIRDFSPSASGDACVTSNDPETAEYNFTSSSGACSILWVAGF